MFATYQDCHKKTESDHKDQNPDYLRDIDKFEMVRNAANGMA